MNFFDIWIRFVIVAAVIIGIVQIIAILNIAAAIK